jgi:hypothetical protein
MRSFFLAVCVMLAAPISALALPFTLQGASPGVTLSSGLDFSSGNYGARQSTDILVGITDITVKDDDFQFAVSEPYLDIKGPDSVIAGAGGVPVAIRPGTVPAIRSKRSGWGDLNLSATWSPSGDWTGDYDIALTGRTKIATANAAKGLSSGETDFDFSVDVSRSFGDWSPFVDFGYRVPGNPSSYALNSAPSFSLGASWQAGDRLVVIASYDFDGSISNSLADSQQLFTSLSWIITGSLTATVYGEMGMSSGAPRAGTGLLLGWKIL